MDAIFIVHISKQASGNISFIGQLNEIVIAKFIVESMKAPYTSKVRPPGNKDRTSQS